MMKYIKNLQKIYFLFIISILLFGISCATPTPLNLDQSICETVLVYPLFDGRNVKNINLENIGGSNIKAYPVSSYYMGKNYNCILRFAYDAGIVPSDSYFDLQNNNSENLKLLKTNGENYILLFYINELQYSTGNTTVFGSMEAFLVRVVNGQVIWHNSAKQTQWLGLLGSLDRAILSGVNNPAFQIYNSTLTKTLKEFPQLTKESYPQESNKE